MSKMILQNIAVIVTLSICGTTLYADKTTCTVWTGLNCGGDVVTSYHGTGICDCMTRAFYAGAKSWKYSFGKCQTFGQKEE